MAWIQVRVEVQRGEGSSAKIISVVVLRDVPIDVAVLPARGLSPLAAPQRVLENAVRALGGCLRSPALALLRRARG